MSWKRDVRQALAVGLAALTLVGCAGDGAPDGERQGRSGGSRGDRRGGGPPGRDAAPAAIPVEVATVERRDISSFIETNGTLEAENEVDVVARTSAPIVELLAEEGMSIREGQVLARLDEPELQARLGISRVALEEARLAFDRAERLYAGRLISDADYEQARSQFESAQAQVQSDEIQLGYATVVAPFDGTVVARYVDLAEQVSVNTPLFRLSDFDPLLCPIQVPERELPRLRRGQRAHLTVEPWPGEKFDARVLRISPVVSASTGTIKVTLEVRSRGKLRPGMFARVFVQTETREDALVLPKAALSLESVGDTVYVAEDAVAARREVRLGFREGDFVEIVSGVSEGETVVVVGQDGLSDGTPIEILGSGRTAEASPPSDDEPTADRPRGPSGQRPGGDRPRPDFASMTPEQLDAAKERMRARGMSEEQIERMIQRGRERSETDTR
jgi:membrane fusion protein (multidrug efflux system)